jgi:hypothetical protein
LIIEENQDGDRHRKGAPSTTAKTVKAPVASD